jgi:hypothetical protein
MVGIASSMQLCIKWSGRMDGRVFIRLTHQYMRVSQQMMYSELVQLILIDDKQISIAV